MAACAVELANKFRASQGGIKRDRFWVMQKTPFLAEGSLIGLQIC